ncbi:MAG: hypothetical protein ACJAVL_001511 [Bacteroidia bacterium]|jgi:hypothetical protein
MSEPTPKTISGKSILMLFIGTNIIYAVMLLVTIPQVMAFATCHFHPNPTTRSFDT